MPLKEIERVIAAHVLARSAWETSWPAAAIEAINLFMLKGIHAMDCCSDFTDGKRSREGTGTSRTLARFFWPWRFQAPTCC